MLAVTLALNMPINLAVLRWDEELGDRSRWRRLRRRWDRIHTAPVLLDRSPRLRAGGGSGDIALTHPPSMAARC